MSIMSSPNGFPFSMLMSTMYLCAFPEVSWFSLPKFSLAQNNPESLPFTLHYMSECLYSFNPQYARSNASEPGLFPLPISHPTTNPEGLFTV